MIRATNLHKRPVIDVDAGTRLGELSDLVLDPPRQRLVGLVVTPYQTSFSSGRQALLPASRLHGVRPDAITVRGAGELVFAMWHLPDLPRLSLLLGRTVASYSGTVLGVLDDVLIDEENGRIGGYPLRAAHFLGTLERWLAGESADRRWDYVRADADLRIDNTLIAVPDDAVVRGRVEATALTT